MSEKRFTMYKNDHTLIDKLTGHICEFPNQKYAETCCKWLNELSEENERLKSLHIDILERIVNEDFYQEIFKEYLLENERRKLGENYE